MQVLFRLFFFQTSHTLQKHSIGAVSLRHFSHIGLWLVSGCVQAVVTLVLICWFFLLGVVTIGSVAVRVGFLTSLSVVHKFTLILKTDLLELISQQRTTMESSRLTAVRGFCLARLSLEDEVYWDKLDSCLSLEEVATAWVR